VALQFLSPLVKSGLLSAESVEGFLGFHGERVAELNTPDRIGRALVASGLLTNFQLQRILGGQLHGLVLGNYRLLDKLGGGSVGLVYLAEHMHLKRRVAMKVLPTDEQFPASVLQRFYGEMRVLAQLNHPHIVSAYDAGNLPPNDRNGQTLHYLAMELLDGDLEEYVFEHGALPIPQACEWIRQAAVGLQAAHDHHVIHRDLKPSNLLRTEGNQIKLVDFGLAREFSSNRTERRCLLGSVEFMPPEQSLDPSAVREPADIYGLGATLYWMLTGHTPYPRDENVADALRRLQVEPPRRLRQFLPDAPQELDELIAKMLARLPDQRPESARSVMQALARFAAPDSSSWESSLLEAAPVEAAASPNESAPRPWGVMILDDDAAVRKTLRIVVESLGCIVHEAEEPLTAMEVINAEPIDLLLLDLNLPGVHGYEVCKALRAHPPRAHLKIVIASGDCGPDELTTAMENGADDFIAKPVPLAQLAARVRHNLRLKGAQDRLDQLARHMMTVNKQLEHSLQTRDRDARRTEDAMLFAIAKLAETREVGTSSHLRRLQKFVVCLAERLKKDPIWSSLVDRSFIENLERCAPLHDLGKVGLPDYLVLRNGPLSEDERGIMESHTTIGSDLIDMIGREYGQSLEFLNVARAIIRHHHERFDGRGYPDRLAGDNIPAAARVFTLADVYDSLRRERPHRAGLTHEQAAHVILTQSPGLFDPAVQRAFAACQAEFAQIYDSIVD
jgi:response regulator RpfG family c-di-GMP phosphodiesterase